MAAGLAFATALAGADAHPSKGTPMKLAAVSPNPVCKISLRVTIAIPV
jgi:hypothetical protein